MAVSTLMVWEVRTTGASTNGGGFKTGASGTDYSQQDAAQYALTGLTTSGAGSIILTSSAAANMVGNVIQITSGTNFTQGFFEITSVSVGVSITVSTNQAGTAVATGVGASGVGNIGGAFKFGNSGIDATFSGGINAGNTVYIKNGSYTALSLAFTNGTAANPMNIQGYNSSRGDLPMDSTRPSINVGSSQFNSGSFCLFQSCILTGTAGTMAASNGNNVWRNVKFTNTSTTANRIALAPGAEDLVFRCEIVSQNGIGITENGDLCVVGCYIHDCSIGIRQQATGSITQVINNIIAGCFTEAMNCSGADTSLALFYGNTIYGAEAQLGIGLLLASGVTACNVISNIFYGCTTGVSAAANTPGFSNYNDYNNNGTNRTNWSTGNADSTLAPMFMNVTTLSASGTASISGSVLTDNGSSFANVVDNQDYCYISGGTGATTGIYLITGHTTHTITLATAPGGSASNASYTVRTGSNFGIGGNLKALGFPTVFPGMLSTSYTDIGAVQRQEPTLASTFSG